MRKVTSFVPQTTNLPKSDESVLQSLTCSLVAFMYNSVKCWFCGCERQQKKEGKEREEKKETFDSGFS